jgi:hypothetical protein
MYEEKMSVAVPESFFGIIVGFCSARIQIQVESQKFSVEEYLNFHFM